MSRLIYILAVTALLIGCEKPHAPVKTNELPKRPKLVVPTPTATPTPVSTPTPTPTTKPTPTPREEPPSEEVVWGESKFAFQEERWKKAQVKSINAIALDKAASIYTRNEARYRNLAKQSGVPSSIIFVLHGRESSWDFTRHLHNGDRLTARTWQVPAGRPKRGNPPFTFEESALDALEYDHMAGPQWDKAGDGLQKLEAYNGIGYQKYHPNTPSPYLWAGTSIYTSGKYIADGKWSSTAVDKQLGVAGIMKWMIEKGIKVWPEVK